MSDNAAEHLAHRAEAYTAALRASGLTIYDPIAVGDPGLWIPSPEMEYLLDSGLRGLVLAGLPLRTRSKVVKEHVCQALGYLVPASFKKTQPRFLGQQLDIYVQKSNNLQIWNEELSAIRRYAIIRVSADDVVTKVKVVDGASLALLDTTGTLTKKYQARCIVGEEATELISTSDTEIIEPVTRAEAHLGAVGSPTSEPSTGSLLPIAEIYRLLSPLVGQSFRDPGSDQERSRGADLHRLVCRALGYATYQDDGRFPDVRHQLLEVKLQSAPTIDLGLVCPDDIDLLEVPMLNGKQVRHCDVRYAIFYAKIERGVVELTHFYLTTGAMFFTRFPQFGGKVLNAKIQIPLPLDFFSRQAEG